MKTVQMKKKRNKILKEIKSKLKYARECKIDRVVEEMGNTHDDAKMFSAIKRLKTNRKQNKAVHDEDGKNVTNEREKYGIIQKHFKHQFFDPTKTTLQPFEGEPAALNNPITPEEIRACVKKMSNNKSPGDDEMTIEMVKYGPSELINEIANTLNSMLEQHDLRGTDIGKSVLITIQKPGKEAGPVENLRPINLLNTIRKILSNVTLARINTQVDGYLSQSQSAYRQGRSTSDVVWAHRWLAAKAQKYQNTKINITGFDMSSAFDTVERDKLLYELSSFLGEDEMRMCRILLSNTSIIIRNNNVKAEPFKTNIGSPQGDGISGTFFNVYFERALRAIREEMNNEIPHIEHSYAVSSSIPNEAIYADDADFITDDEYKRQKLNQIVPDLLAQENLKVNNSKTEHTTIERKKPDEEDWRSVKKLGSMLGDSEDLKYRKQKATAALSSMNSTWIRKKKINVNKRIQLYNSIVKPVLTYNSSTWGLTKSELNSLDAFHRQQLRRVCGNLRMRNRRLYEQCKSNPVSQEIAKSRMRLFGHVLRLNQQTPAQKSMQFYFENHDQSRQFRGKPRTTIATVINKEISNAALQHNNPLYPQKLKSLEDLQKLRMLAADRSAWKKFSDLICDTAQVKSPIPNQSTAQDESA